MKKLSTAAAHKSGKVEGQRMTVGLDVGDRSSWYCVLEAPSEPSLTKSADGRVAILARLERNK